MRSADDISCVEVERMAILARYGVSHRDLAGHLDTTELGVTCGVLQAEIRTSDRRRHGQHETLRAGNARLQAERLARFGYH